LISIAHNIFHADQNKHDQYFFNLLTPPGSFGISHRAILVEIESAEGFLSWSFFFGKRVVQK
jgi:hypothetical protein